MIDTIRGYLDLTPIPDLDLIPISSLTPRIENPKIQQNLESQTGYLKGMIKNFKVSIRYPLHNEVAKQISIEGSIPKFLYGNNIASCTPSDVHLVLDTLSDIIEVPLDNLKITRLDFGFNFVVKRPVANYIQAIQGYPRRQRVLHQGQTVDFRIKTDYQGVTFYDKLKEMKKDMKSREAFKALPEFIKHLNILRFEVKIKKYSEKPILGKELRFTDLYSPDTFQRLIDHLAKELNTVNIVEFDIPSNSFVSGRGWVKDFLAMIGLREYGLNEMYNLIDSQEYDVKNPSVTRSQYKRSVRELVSQSNELHSTSIISELESKLEALYGILI